MSVRGATPSEFLPGGDDHAATDAFSLIDRDSSFDGTWRSERDLRIEGEAKGTIECRGTLFVADGAVVHATVEAEGVVVAGELTGEIRCRGRLQLMPSGRVRGKVSTRGLVINEGAIYEGQLEMPAGDGEGRSSQATFNAPVPISAAGEGRGGATTFIRRLGGPETPWDDAEAEGTTEREATERDG